MPLPSPNYIGRFAPSPSGPLHFGSLVCALASYLDAKSQAGKWLVRMEDIDPPREQANAKTAILHALEKHGLHWEGEVVFQSQRTEAYLSALSKLRQHGFSYPCNCTRKRLSELSQAYDGHCLQYPPAPDSASAVRINIQSIAITLGLSDDFSHFEDQIQGRIECRLKNIGDFILHRKDGLFAYNLAVVVDDIEQGVTNIVRGADLLETTLQQKLLMAALSFGNRRPPPDIRYSHIPVILDNSGKKLSKQNHAPAIDNRCATSNLIHALQALNIPTPPSQTGLEDLLIWGIQHWQTRPHPRVLTLPL